MAKKNWFVTGCATGFGRALAERALARGDNVAATDRDGEAVADFALSFPETALPLGVDVTSTEEIRSGLDAAFDRFGTLDVLVNNAGFAVQATVEEADMERVRAMMEVNYFGMLSVIRAALPRLRAQGGGHIMNFASVGGRVSGPLMALYCASKFAVEGLSDGLAAEVGPFGIKVTTIEPGAFATRFGTSAVMPESPVAAYEPLRASLHALIENLPQGKAEDLAAALLELADAENPPLKFPGGIDAWQMISDNIDGQRDELDRWKSLSERANSVAAEALQKR